MTARSYRDVVLADAPQGFWRLGERGVKLRDSSGHGRDASVVGTITQGTPGVLPSDADLACYTPGTAGNHVDTGYAPNFGTTGDFTFEAWIRCPTPPTASNYFVWMGYFVSGSFPDVAMFMGSDGKAAWKVSNNASYVAGAVNVADNRWHHTVGVRQGGTIHLYVDGVETGTPVANSGPVSSSGAVLLGAYGNVNDLPYAGWIDEAAVYDHALTPAQIANHYAARTAPGPLRRFIPYLPGGTVYSRTLTATSASTATATKIVQAIRAASPANSTASFTKVVQKPLSATSPAAATLARVVQKVMAPTSTAIATMVKQVQKILLAIEPSAANVGKVNQHIMIATSGSTATMATGTSYQRSLTATSNAAATITAQYIQGSLLRDVFREDYSRNSSSYSTGWKYSDVFRDIQRQGVADNDDSWVARIRNRLRGRF